MTNTKTCKKCGGHDFNPSGKCRPCLRAYSKAYNQENRDAIADRAASRTKPCPKCGAVDFTPYGGCRPCNRKATARYQKANASEIVRRVKERAAVRTAPCDKCGGTEFDSRGQCKPCTAAWHREYRKANRDQVKERTARSARAKGCKHCGGTDFTDWGKCKPCHAAREQARRDGYREAGRSTPCRSCGGMEFNESGACRSCMNRASRACEQRKKDEDPARFVTHARMSRSVRKALHRFADTGKGSKSWTKLVGYSVDELMRRLMSTIPDGFTWDDYVAGRLEIDHIAPVSAHHFHSPECVDFKRCWALTNLQLLPALQNRRKSGKLLAPFQPSLL